MLIDVQVLQYQQFLDFHSLEISTDNTLDSIANALQSNDQTLQIYIYHDYINVQWCSSLTISTVPTFS